MTGIEFRNGVEKYLTNKDITVLEHETLFNELKNVAISTLKEFMCQYHMYVHCKYDVEYYILNNPERVYDVEFFKNELSFSYWDDGYKETSSCVDIPMDDFIKWIDNDIGHVREFIVNYIKRTLKSSMEFDNTRIESIRKSIDENEKFLSKIDNMKMDDIQKWYDSWIDDACHLIGDNWYENS